MEQEILSIRLVADDELDTSIVEKEFPTVRVERAQPRAAQRSGASTGGAGEGESCRPGELVVDDFAWRGSFDVGTFDEAVEHARPVGIVSIRGGDAAGVACEVLARYQRLVARRNDASSTPLFDRVLQVHAAAYDVTNPHVESELAHALDTWQWMLRLEPNASLAAQLAAIFHDVDRLESDPQERIEHRVLDPARLTKAGARAFAMLCEAGVPDAVAARARSIMCTVEDRASDPDAVLLDDADALSFLSLNSSRYADHFGLAQTRRKVAFTVGRLGPRARAKLALVRIRPDVERLLRESAA
jgi:hypothetical protein